MFSQVGFHGFFLLFGKSFDDPKSQIPNLFVMRFITRQEFVRRNNLTQFWMKKERNDFKKVFGLLRTSLRIKKHIHHCLQLPFSVFLSKTIRSKKKPKKNPSYFHAGAGNEDGGGGGGVGMWARAIVTAPLFRPPRLWYSLVSSNHANRWTDSDNAPMLIAIWLIPQPYCRLDDGHFPLSLMRILPFTILSSSSPSPPFPPPHHPPVPSFSLFHPNLFSTRLRLIVCSFARPHVLGMMN